MITQVSFWTPRFFLTRLCKMGPQSVLLSTVFHRFERLCFISGEHMPSAID